VGQKEVADNTVIIRSMKRGTQNTVKRDVLIRELGRRMKRKQKAKKKK